MTDLSVSGIAVKHERVKLTSKIAAFNKRSKRLPWSDLYPALYSTRFMKYSKAAENMHSFTLNSNNLSRSATSILETKQSKHTLDVTQSADDSGISTLRPNSSSSVNLNGQSILVPQNKSRKARDFMQVTKKSECNICQCSYYFQRINKTVNFGRHQKCVCECHCHVDVSELSLFQVAAKLGHTKLVKKLIEKGEQADQLDVHDNTSLHLAAMQGHTATIALLLENDLNPNKPNINGNSALHLAAKYGHLCSVANLQKYGADVNLANYFSDAPIHISVKERKYAIVQNLVKNPELDINLKDRDGNTPLHLAIKYFDANIFSLLLKHPDIDLNLKNKLGQTPLHIAAQCNRPSVLSLLMEVPNLKPDICDKQGNSILHAAVTSGSHTFVEELLKLQKSSDLKMENYSTVNKVDSFLECKNVFGQTALHLAILNNDISLVENLLSEGCNIWSVDAKGNGCLHQASAVGSFTICKILINLGLPLNTVNNSGDTCLHIAAHCGHLKLVKMFLALGADSNTLNLLHESALHRAVKRGFNSLALVLLKNEADYNIMDIDGKTPLHLAVERGNEVLALKMLKWAQEFNFEFADKLGNTLLHLICQKGLQKLADLILQKWPPLLIVANVYGNLPVHVSCKYGHSLLTKKVLDFARSYGYRKQILLAKNIAGKTAFHMCAKSGDVSSLAYLLHDQVYTDVHDQKGRTPLHLACLSRNQSGTSVKVVQLLLGNAAKVDAVDCEGSTPLHYAAKAGNHSILKLLLAHGANIDTANSHRYTPLYLASANGRDKTMEVLIANGADSSAHTKDGNSPLHVIAASGNAAGLSLLIKAGLSPDHENVNGTTAAHLAAFNDHQDVIECLKEAGADLTKVDERGRTPLHVAVAKGNANVVKALLQSGVSVTQKDILGRSPLQYALATQNQEIYHLLKENSRLEDIAELDFTNLNLVNSLPMKKDIIEDLEKDCGIFTNQKISVLDDSRLYSYLNFVHKIDSSSSSFQPQLSVSRWNPIICPRYLFHMKAYGHAPSRLANPRSRLCAHNNCAVQSFSKTLESSKEGQLSKSHQLLSGVEDDADSTCTEDEIADQLGLLSQLDFPSTALAKEELLPDPSTPRCLVKDGPFKHLLPSSGRHFSNTSKVSVRDATPSYINVMHDTIGRGGIVQHPQTLHAKQAAQKEHEREMDEFILPQEIILKSKEEITDIESFVSSQLPSLPSSNLVASPLNTQRNELKPLKIETDNSLTLPSLTQTVAAQPVSKPAVTLPEVRAAQTLNYATIDARQAPQPPKKNKLVSNRRAGQLVMSQNAVESSVRERNKRRWVFEDDEPMAYQESKQIPERPESDMSFVIERRSPSPAPTEVREEGSNEPIGIEEDQTAEEQSVEVGKRKWGKAKVDTRYREEQERQRLAEERKKKAMKMKLARTQHLHFQKIQTKKEEEIGDLSDYDWLAQFCVFSRGTLSMYREIFNALLSSPEESDDSNKIPLEEVLIGLTSMNHELKTVEQEYVLRISETLGYDTAKGCDFRCFSLLAALSQRIASLDEFMRRIYSLLDLRAIDINVHFYKKLWETCCDLDTNTISKGKLAIELKAGGISPLHEEYVTRVLAEKSDLDFLDFLTYIPLFIFIHKSVVGNPLDDSRNR
ncbi:hypothetical protein EB796_016442 [Bugula neritina]|uniref:Uncharacterized protein n=1 Tax=Bugula neritina TaxID=10212 RepID=A0A7J7JFZ0_BUGNE|nr:hypothetical protein EB796_016442 [Bugula neritina]